MTVLLGLVCFVLILIAVLVGVVTQLVMRRANSSNNNDAVGSSMRGTTPDTTETTTHDPTATTTTRMECDECESPFTVWRNGIPKVYVVNSKRATILRHRQAVQDGCGGTGASITSEEEYHMILELVETTLGVDHDGVFLGAYQSKTSNKVGGSESDFSWRDGSTPFYVEWAQGEPDNQLTQLKDGRYRGQHDIMLNAQGLMQDESSVGLDRPVVWILPIDYETNPKYSNCSKEHLRKGY